MSNEYAKTERTSLKMRLRSCALKVAAFLARLKPAILPSQLESEAKTGQSLSISAQLAEAHALIDMAANNGVVPDAHVLSLYDCMLLGLPKLGDNWAKRKQVISPA